MGRDWGYLLDSGNMPSGTGKAKTLFKRYCVGEVITCSYCNTVFHINRFRHASGESINVTCPFCNKVNDVS